MQFSVRSMLRSAASAVCVGFVAAPAAHAIVVHPADDAVSVAHPDPAVVGRWDVDASANASAVAIAPNYILTTRHQGSGVVDSVVEFGGIRYSVAEITPIGSADLRVVRITKENSALPADLEHYTPLFTGDDDGTPNYPVTLGGFGRARDNGPVLTDPSGDTYGYNWESDVDNDSLPDNVNETPFRFGRNIVEGSDTLPSPYPFPSDVILADFDGPGVGGAQAGEAILSEFDSGGGWFVEISPGIWRVAGLSLAVDHTGANTNLAGGTALFASNADADTPAPDILIGLRLSSYAAQINAVVPEPTSLSLVAGGLLLLARRPRTRRA